MMVCIGIGVLELFLLSALFFFVNLIEEVGWDP